MHKTYKKKRQYISPLKTTVISITINVQQEESHSIFQAGPKLRAILSQSYICNITGLKQEAQKSSSGISVIKLVVPGKHYTAILTVVNSCCPMLACSLSCPKIKPESNEGKINLC